MRILSGKTILLSLVCLISFFMQVQTSPWGNNPQSVELPPLRNTDTLTVNLNRPIQINEPNYNFNRVYHKSVKQVINGVEVGTEECQENPPEVEFDIDDYFRFAEVVENKQTSEKGSKDSLIDNFDDLLFQQNLLDVYYDGETSHGHSHHQGSQGKNKNQRKVYMIFKNGEIVIVTLHSDEKINKSSYKKIQLGHFEQHQYLSKGYFVKLSHGPYRSVEDSILFVNELHAILIKDTEAFILSGLDTTYNNFQSVEAVHDRQYLAITYLNQGVVFYDLTQSMDESKTEDESQYFLKKVYEIPVYQFPSHMGGIHIVDVAYYSTSSMKTLLVLDEKEGIIGFDLHHSVPTAGKESLISIKRAFTVKKISNCELMYLYSNNLYTICRGYNPIKFQLSLTYSGQQDTLISNILTYQSPGIRVRQIYEYGNMIAFVGRNSFKLIYEDHAVNYQQNQGKQQIVTQGSQSQQTIYRDIKQIQVDKMIFAEDMYIKAGEKGVIIGDYHIIDPYVTCLFDMQFGEKEKSVGNHTYVFKTIAECSKEFIELAGLDISKIEGLKDTQLTYHQTYGEQIFCEYKVYRDIQINNEYQNSKEEILAVMGLSLAIVGGGLLILAAVWALERYRVYTIRKQVIGGFYEEQDASKTEKQFDDSNKPAKTGQSIQREIQL